MLLYMGNVVYTRYLPTYLMCYIYNSPHKSNSVNLYDELTYISEDHLALLGNELRFGLSRVVIAECSILTHTKQSRDAAQCDYT